MTAIVVGPATRDRWRDDGVVLPGGGALNVAYHWVRRGRQCELLTRVGDDDGDEIRRFLSRHGIVTGADTFVDGPSAEITVDIARDRQPDMHHFEPGVWNRFRSSDEEVRRIAASVATHLVMVDAVLDEVERWQVDGTADEMTLTADFLAMRHVPFDRFARIAPALDLAVTGWPGRPDDAAVDELIEVARAVDTTLVVTFGAHGVRVADSDGDHWFGIEEQPVLGTTTGCGDAFIAAFLDVWLDGGDLAAAVAAGADLGAAATGWHHALPPTAY